MTLSPFWLSTDAIVILSWFSEDPREKERRERRERRLRDETADDEKSSRDELKEKQAIKVSTQTFG